MDGLLLTGGTDVDPARYGQAPHRETDEPDDGRDEFELALLARALDAELPVFAICRGMQLLNVGLGGTLVQHVIGHRLVGGGTHPAHVKADSPLAAITGSPQITINSRHHQVLDRLGAGLVVCANAPDGAIEAVFRPGPSMVLAVQWHPEDRVAESASDRSLFEAFAAACAVRPRSPHGVEPLTEEAVTESIRYKLRA
jgi:putative glutamine amidotransferase